MKKLLLVLLLASTVFAGYCNNDGVCDSDKGETALLCPSDCAIETQVTEQGKLYSTYEPTTFPSSLKAGQKDVLVEVVLTNYWKQNYYDVTAELLLTQTFGKVKTTDFVSRINPGERASIFYRINIADSAAPGEHVLTQKLTYYYDKTVGSEVTKVKVEQRRTIKLGLSYTHRLEMGKVQLTPKKLLPGQVGTLEVTLDNTGDLPANDIAVDIALSTSSTDVELLPPTEKHIDYIASGENGAIEFKVKANNLASAGAHSATVAVEYGDNTLSDSFTITIVNSACVDVSNIRFDGKPVIGRASALLIGIENKGYDSIYALQAMLTSDDDEVAVVSDSHVYIGELKAGETKDVSYNIWVDRDAGEEAYSLSFELDSSELENLDSQTISFKAVGLPDIRVGAAESGKGDIFAQTPFSLSVSLENIGTGEMFASKAKITAPDTMRGILSTYIGSIGADDTEVAYFDVTDSRPGRKELELELTYEDDQGTEYTITGKTPYIVHTKPIGIFPILFVVGAVGYYFYRKRKQKKPAGENK